MLKMDNEIKRITKCVQDCLRFLGGDIPLNVLIYFRLLVVYTSHTPILHQ